MMAIYKDNIEFAKLSGSPVESEPTNTSVAQEPSMQPSRPPQSATYRVQPASTDELLQHVFTGIPKQLEANHIKVLADGGKLQIAGFNVDLEGIGTLRKMLEKYEEIIKLQKGEK